MSRSYGMATGLLCICLKQRSFIAIRKKIIIKQSFIILNTILYFLMLMNTCQFLLWNQQGVGLVGLPPFLLFTLYYLSEHSHSDTGLVLRITRNFIFYLLFAFSLFLWLNKFKCFPYPFHHQDCLKVSYVMLRG